jgi:hypothetical protein
MFEVTRYEHPEIFVTARQTAETYRFSVRADRTLAYSGTTSEHREAWRAAVAYLARIWRPYAA